MSCVIGIEKDGYIYFGADSCATSCYEQRTRLDEKIFIVGDYLIGYTGSPAVGQCIRDYWKPPKNIKEVSNSIKTILIENNLKCQENTEDGNYNETSFIFSKDGKIYEIMSDFQVSEYVDKYYSIGSGRFFSLGSLYETEDKDPIERIIRALKCSEYFTPGVRRPFHIYINDCKYGNRYSKKEIIR